MPAAAGLEADDQAYRARGVGVLGEHGFLSATEEREQCGDEAQCLCHGNSRILSEHLRRLNCYILSSVFCLNRRSTSILGATPSPLRGRQSRREGWGEGDQSSDRAPSP